MGNAITGRNGSVKFGSAGTIVDPTVADFKTGTAFTQNSYVTDGALFYKVLVAIDVSNADEISALITANKLSAGQNTPDYTITPPATVTAIANLNDWKIDTDIDTKEAPVFGTYGWKKKSAGMQSWSGSADGYFDKSDTQGQKALRAAAISGSETYLKLNADVSTSFEGNVFIKKISIETPADDQIKFSFDFEGNGPLVEG